MVMRYRDRSGCRRLESTNTEDWQEAQRQLRERLQARDNKTLDTIPKGEQLTFGDWADFFAENYSKPPNRAIKTHEVNENALRTPRPAFGSMKLTDIDATGIEIHVRNRLKQHKRVRRKSGVVELGLLKPSTAHQKFRVLRRILSVAVKKKLCPANPCAGVEFPVILKGLFRPHYMTWSGQQKIEECSPTYLRNAIRILIETGLRIYKELAPTRKDQVDLANRMIFIADSKTPTGVAEVPLTDIVVEAFRNQIELADAGPWLFPSPMKPRGYQTNFKKPWETALRKAGIPYFRLYDLRSTHATRLSAGGVADEWVTQMLRQTDAKVLRSIRNFR
jgi:integrase